MASVTELIEPIWLPPCSMNHISPPGPGVMATGAAAVSVKGYSTIVERRRRSSIASTMGAVRSRRRGRPLREFAGRRARGRYHITVTPMSGRRQESRDASGEDRGTSLRRDSRRRPRSPVHRPLARTGSTIYKVFAPVERDTSTGLRQRMSNSPDLQSSPSSIRASRRSSSNHGPRLRNQGKGKRPASVRASSLVRSSRRRASPRKIRRPSAPRGRIRRVASDLAVHPARGPILSLRVEKHRKDPTPMLPVIGVIRLDEEAAPASARDARPPGTPA